MDNNRISKFLAQCDEHCETLDDMERFADAERDDESGLHFHDRRCYDPTTRECISTEPIAFAGDGPVTPYVGEASDPKGECDNGGGVG